MWVACMSQSAGKDNCVLGVEAFLRLPSQDPEGKVHRIKVDDLHKDLLAEKDKPLYSKYKLGIVEYGPQWEEESQ